MVANRQHAREFGVFGGNEAVRRTDTGKGHELRSNVSKGQRNDGRLSCGGEAGKKGRHVPNSSCAVRLERVSG